MYSMDFVEIARNIGGCIFATFCIMGIRYIYFTLGDK